MTETQEGENTVRDDNNQYPAKDREDAADEGWHFRDDEASGAYDDGKD